MSFTPEQENKLNRALIDTLRAMVQGRNAAIKKLKEEKGVLHRRLNEKEEDESEPEPPLENHRFLNDDEIISWKDLEAKYP